MSSGWLRRRLGDLLSVQNGFAFDSKQFGHSGFPLIRIRDLEEGLSTETKYAGSYEERYVVRRGDLLIGMDGEFACHVWRGGPALLNQRVCRLQGFSAQLNPKFLFYGINSYLKEIEDATGFTTVKHLSSKQILRIEFPVPSMAEQQRIVAILDEAFEGTATAKANVEKNLRNAKGLFASHLQSIFGKPDDSWVRSTIGDSVRFIDYRGKTPDKAQSGLRLITAKNVKMGFLQREPEEFVAPETYEGWMTRGIPRKGDVLFTTEAPLANVAQLDTDERVVFAQRIIIMRPDDGGLDSTFLKYMLLSKPLQDRIHAKGTGATVKGIKASLLRTVEISYPKELVEQQRLVSSMDELSAEAQRLSAIYMQKLSALDDLKKSLLHHAFSGQL